jgi:hypothetical protein
VLVAVRYADQDGTPCMMCDLQLEDPRFDYRLRKPLAQMTLSKYFSICSGKFRYTASNFTMTDAFHIISNLHILLLLDNM